MWSSIDSASARRVVAAAVAVTAVALPASAAVAAGNTKPGRYAGTIDNEHTHIVVQVARRTVTVTGRYVAECSSGKTVRGALTTKPARRRNESVLSGEKPRDRHLNYFDAKRTYVVRSHGVRHRISYDVFGGPIGPRKVSGGWYVEIETLGANGAVTDDCATDGSGIGSHWYSLGGGDGYVARRR